MTLKYEVRPNHLKPGRWYPRVVLGERVPYQRLIDDAARETLVTETDARAVINVFIHRLVDYLAQGRVPEIEGIASFSISLSEELDSDEAAVSDAVEIRVNARTDADMSKKVRAKIVFEKVRVRGRRPALDSFTDVRSEQRNVYTAGSVAKLKGDDLKFDPDLTDEGVFFVSANGGGIARCEVYSRLGSNIVDFMVPDDLVGPQYVEVHTRHGSKEMRTARLKSIVNPVT
jgi:nucleoid DNA-binding protein